MGPLNIDGGTAMQAAFPKKINADVSGLVYGAGVLASQNGSDKKPTFPGVRACLPIILRLAYNAVTDPDPAARASALLAAKRLTIIAAQRDFKVTKGAPS